MLKPITALKTYFGQQPGQTLRGFQEEVIALKKQCGSQEKYIEFCKEVAEALGEKLDLS